MPGEKFKSLVLKIETSKRIQIKLTQILNEKFNNLHEKFSKETEIL
jgi:hypothetical protein